jgi:hypothetical protein
MAEEEIIKEAAETVALETEETTSETPKPREGWFLGPLLESIRGFFVAQFEAVWSGFLEMLPHAIYKTFDTTAGVINIGEDAGWEAIFRLLTDTGVLDRRSVEALTNFKGLPFPINTIFNVIAISSIVGNYLKDVSSIIELPAKYDLMAKITPEIPSYRDIIQAAFVAPEKTGEIRDVMKRSGLPDEYIDMVFLSAYRLYPEETVRTAWLRGVIDDDQMYMRMRELGYTDTRTREIIQTWPLIPGPSDLFHLVAREAFEPKAIAMMGLEDEFPEDQVEWLQKQGISRDWAVKYWIAHWEQPSIQQGFEMLHRGVIGLEELDMLFRTVEIPPYWRDRLTKIAFQPFTRVDSRRMHKLGVLGDDELVKVYMDQGYDEWHAQKMAEFTIRYNRQTEKSLTRGQILQGYREDLISKQDAISLLIETDYKDEQAEYFILLEDYKKAKDLQDDMVDNIKDRFVNNLMDAHEAREKLNKLDLPQNKISVLMEEWETKVYVDRKLPSKTDLDKFLKAKIITEDTYRFEMQKLGYGSEYISWYVKLKGK